MSLDRLLVWGKSVFDSAAIHAQAPWDELQAVLAPASLHTKMQEGGTGTQGLMYSLGDKLPGSLIGKENP